MFSVSCIRKPVFLLALAASLLAMPLWAEEKPATLKDEWKVSMAKGEKEGFAYCLMRGDYSNGLQLAVALSPRKEVNIGVNVPDGGFKNGENHPMTVTVDDLLKKEGPGFAPQADLIMVPMGPDPKVITALGRGRVLSVAGPQDTAHFSLKGTKKALASLQDCVDVGTGKKKMPTAPAVAAGKDPKAFPSDLMALLKSAGLTDVQPVPIPDPSKAPIDFGWRTNGVMGGLRERPVPADTTLEKMRDMIEAGYKKECSSTYKSSFAPTENLPGVKLSTIDVSCQIGDKVANVALLVYLTDTNLFSMFMHEGQDDMKVKAVYVRDTLANTIRKLAHEQAAKKAAPQPVSMAPAAAPPAPTVPTPPAAPPSSTEIKPK